MNSENNFYNHHCIFANEYYITALHNYLFFQSKINVASLGVRAIQKRLLSSGFSKTVDIQVSVNDFLT